MLNPRVFSWRMRALRSSRWMGWGRHRGLRVGVVSSLGAFLMLAALCPLPAMADAADQPQWGDRGSIPMECPFHPGRAATISSALQFSLQHTQAVAPDETPTAPAGLLAETGVIVFASAFLRPLAARVVRPASVPLYLLHASLIR